MSALFNYALSDSTSLAFDITQSYANKLKNEFKHLCSLIKYCNFCCNITTNNVGLFEGLKS